VVVVLGAIVGKPDRIALSPVALGHRPRAGEHMIDGGNLVIEKALRLVEEDALTVGGLQRVVGVESA
jgi:hypothetical protein